MQAWSPSAQFCAHSKTFSQSEPVSQAFASAQHEPWMQTEHVSVPLAIEPQSAGAPPPLLPEPAVPALLPEPALFEPAAPPTTVAPLLPPLPLLHATSAQSIADPAAKPIFIIMFFMVRTLSENAVLGYHSLDGLVRPSRDALTVVGCLSSVKHFARRGRDLASIPETLEK